MISPPSSPPPPDDEALLAIVDAAAPFLGIAVDPAWRDAVAASLKATTIAARLVLEFPLPDELEPAPAFRA